MEFQSNQINFKIFNSISNIDSATWDGLLYPAHATCSWECLKAIEGSECSKGTIFNYFVFYSNGNVIATALTFIINVEICKLVPANIRPFIRLLGPLQKFKVLMCGNYISDGLEGIFCKDKNLLPEIVSALAKETDALAVSHRCAGIIFKEFEPNDIRYYDTLLKQRYFKVLSLPSHYLNIRWKNLDEYKNDLNRKYRQSFTKTRNKIVADEIQIDIIDIPESFMQSHYELYLYVHSKAQFQIETMSVDFFQNILQVMKDKASIIVMNKSGQAIGFCLTFDCKETLQAIFLGYDEHTNNTYDIYYNLLFHCVEIAAVNGKKLLTLGQTADSFKLRMGCDHKEKYFYMKFRNHLVHHVMRLVSPSIFEKVILEKRSVFKSQ